MMVLSFLHTPAHTHTYTYTPVLVEQSQLTSLSMSYRDKFLSFFHLFVVQTLSWKGHFSCCAV